MSVERSIKQYEDDRREAAKLAARLLLASATTSPRVGGVGECTVHILDDECGIEDLCQATEQMAGEDGQWGFFKRDAMMLRDADAVLLAAHPEWLDRYESWAGKASAASRPRA